MHAERLAPRPSTPVLPMPPEIERVAGTDFEFRTVDYCSGWDPEDADLGWVDADVIRGSRRLH